MAKQDDVIQNEAMLLGAILQDQTIIDEITIEPKDFSFDKNRDIYKEMLRLYENNENVSFINLSKLPEDKLKKIGGVSYLADVANSTPSVTAFHRYEKVIKENRLIENARKLASTFIEGTTNTNDVELLNTFLQSVSSLETNTVGNHDSFMDKLKKRATEHFESKADGLSGIDTGFKITNSYTDGWQKGELIVVAGRPSMGKTAFVLDSMLKSCTNQSYVFGTFFSIEMSDGMVIDRMIANLARINVNKMRNPNKTFNSDDWSRHSMALGELQWINFDLRGEKTVSEIRAATRKNMKNHPEKQHFIAIDYLTLMKAGKSRGSKTEEVENIINGLKDIAKQLNIPVIVLSQLSRGVESRDNKRPNLGDLRDSGAIEQTADVAIMLYRDEYYHEDTQEPRVVELIFAKNRQGSTGTVKLFFDKKTNRFHDME